MSSTSQVVGAIVASVCLYILLAFVLKQLLDGDSAPAPDAPRPVRTARHRKESR